MRQNYRFILVPLTAMLLVSVTSAIFAQQTGKARVQTGQATQPAPKQPAQQNPAAQPVRSAAAVLPKVNQKPPAIKDKEEEVEDETDPALDALLKKWEAESAKIKSLHGRQSRKEVNRVFAVEKVSQGAFFLEMPDKGRIDMLAVKGVDGKPGERKDKDGNPFRLESGTSERWICTGTEILMINEVEKTFQKEPIPKEQQGKNIVHSPLPFLFGMKADEAKERYKLTLTKETKDQYVLQVDPKLLKDKQNYRVAQVKLNKKTFLPDEVQMIDDSNLQIIYRFENVEVNDKDPRSAVQRIFMVKEDPYKPNLKGYTEVVPSEDPITERENRQMKGPAVPNAQQHGGAQQVNGEAPATPRPATPKPKAPAQRPDASKK